MFHRSTIKLARGDSPRKFSIFFSEPTFPEIEIGEQRTTHDIEKVPFSFLVNFQIDPQTLNSIKSLSTDPTTFDQRQNSHRGNKKRPNNECLSFRGAGERGKEARPRIRDDEHFNMTESSYTLLLLLLLFIKSLIYPVLSCTPSSPPSRPSRTFTVLEE